MKANKNPSGKSIPRIMLPRIYRIDKEIASGCFPNAGNLAKICEVSIATISRDIDVMRDQLFAPIDYDASKRGLYYTEKAFRLPAGYTTADDLLALNMAKSIFSLYQDTPLYEASRNLLDSILTPIASDGSSDLLKNRIMVPPIASAKVDSKIWETIIAGLKQNRIITFDYHGIWNEETQSRKVHPYQLLFDSGIWLLFGFSEERGATRLFSLSRITDPKLTNEVFTLPKNYSYGDFTSDSYFGVFIGQEKKTFVIDCYDEAAHFASERQWAADQKIIKNDDCITIQFSSTQYYKVLRWALSFGANAIPRKPKKLVDEWKWHIQELKQQVLE